MLCCTERGRLNLVEHSFTCSVHATSMPNAVRPWHKTVLKMTT
jgi:hypothetical protein